MIVSFHRTHLATALTSAKSCTIVVNAWYTTPTAPSRPSYPQATLFYGLLTKMWKPHSRPARVRTGTKLHKPHTHKRWMECKFFSFMQLGRQSDTYPMAPKKFYTLMEVLKLSMQMAPMKHWCLILMKRCLVVRHLKNNTLTLCNKSHRKQLTHTCTLTTKVTISLNSKC